MNESADLLQRLEQLVEIGVSLSREHDTDKLLEQILVAAKSITNADGGTLYRMPLCESSTTARAPFSRTSSTTFCSRSSWMPNVHSETK